MTSFEQKRYYNFHRTTKKIIDHTIHIPFHIILPIDQRIILISLTDIPKDFIHYSLIFSYPIQVSLHKRTTIKIIIQLLQ